jgi:hypothetical protein
MFKPVLSLRRLVALAAVLLFPAPAFAIYHLTAIDEVVTSYNGQADQQLIQLRELAIVQNNLTNSVLAAFDSTGNYLGDILVLPAGVPSGGPDLHWTVATKEFQDANHVTTDFTMSATLLPAFGGMVCYGGGGGLAPKNPPDWDRTDFTNYVDCLAYGTYIGPTNHLIGKPTRETPVGHSVQRIAISDNNAADFACGQPIIVTSNSGASFALPATVPCGCTVRPRIVLRRFPPPR